MNRQLSSVKSDKQMVYKGDGARARRSQSLRRAAIAEGREKKENSSVTKRRDGRWRWAKSSGRRGFAQKSMEETREAMREVRFAWCRARF